MGKILDHSDLVTDRLTKETEKELLQSYRDANKSIKKKLRRIYDKYEIEGEISYSEITKYNRLKNLQKDIDKEIHKLSNRTGNEIRTLSTYAYEVGFYRTAFAIEKEVQAKLSYGKLNSKTVRASVQNPISGLTLNETLNRNRKQVVSDIRREITQGLINGESYSKMAKRIEKSLERDYNKAVRVANTEAHRCQNAGKLASIEHAEKIGVVMYKVWVATIDRSTRDAHQGMDGQRVRKDEDFVSPTGVSGPAPGMLGSAEDDINCRCTFIIEVEGFEPTTRRVRGEGVVPYENFEDWAKEKEIPVR